MAKRRYGYEISPMYNCFDALVAVECALYREGEEGGWSFMNSWQYDAILLPRSLAWKRAASKARSLVRDLGAVEM